MPEALVATPSLPEVPPVRDFAAEVEATLDALSDVRRRAAALHAEEVRLLAGAVELGLAQGRAAADSRDSDIPLRSLAAQIGAALRVSDRTVDRQLSSAHLVWSRFPASLTAVSEGEISPSHLRVIVEAGARIDDDGNRAVYEEAALDIARREAPGRLRPAARLLAERLLPSSLSERHTRAARGRDVFVRDLDDGMAELIAILPAALAHGIRDRLDRFAWAIAEAGEGSTPSEHLEITADRSTSDASTPVAACRRGVGERRADAFADLLLTGHASPEVSGRSLPEQDAIVAQVQLTIPVMTVLGHDDTPAQVAGRAPVDASTALRLAAGAPGWDRVLTHPITAAVLAVDRYRPSADMTRILRARDEHCRFPGCRMPVRRCDVDHTVARQHDGPTSLDNLAHLCRRHHTLKHHSAWRVHHGPNGVLHWTSPTGRTYPDRPARTLVFVPADEGPPGDPPSTDDPPPF